MATRAQIEAVVVTALEKMVDTNTGAAKFSFALVPSKSLRDGGLGLTWNGWHANLGAFLQLLPNQKPYSKLVVDVRWVDDTYTKDLRSFRYQTVERLLLHEAYGV
jgi:hypothetical protein